jgi:hypothetical protein
MRRINRFYLALLLALTIAYFSVGSYRNYPYKIESDGKYYYIYLVSAFFDGDLDFTNNYLTPAYEWMRLPIDHYSSHKFINPITQKPANVFTVGPAILWSPFMLASYGLGSLINTIAPNTLDLGAWGLYLQYGVMLSAVVYAVLTLWGFEALLRYIMPDLNRKALRWAQLLLLTTSPMLYYSLFEVSMSHIYDLFTLTAYMALLAGVIAKPTPLWQYAALGVFGGLHILVRTQNVVVIALLSVVLAVAHFKFSPRPASSAKWFFGESKLLVVYAITLVLATLPLPIVNYTLYANVFYVPQGEGFLNPTAPNLLGVLFSMRNGLFSHHPALLVGLMGFGLLAWQKRYQPVALTLLVALALVFVAQTYLNAIVDDWWGGHAFGQRRLLSSVLMFGVGYAAMFDWVLRRNSRVFIQRGVFALTSLVAGLGVMLLLVHVLWWDYDQPHNIARWLFEYAPRKIASDLSRPWATYLPIQRPFATSLPIRLSGGQPYQETVIHTPTMLQAGKRYALELEYATTSDAKPVIVFAPKPLPNKRNPTVILLQETLSRTANYVTPRFSFIAPAEMKDLDLKLQNWGKDGIFGVQKLALYEVILPLPEPPPPPLPTRFLFY